MNAIARGVSLALLALAGLAVGGAMDFHDGVERVVVDGGSAGPLRLYSAEARIGRVVVQISDAHGWTPADEILARDLAGDGALVVGVDLHALADENNEQTDGCHWISGMLENVGRLAERHVGLPRYRAPLLVGRGSGGMLAYGAAVEALEGMFEGAVAVKPVPTLPLLAPICLEAETTPVRDGRAYGPLDKGDIPVVVVDDGPGMPVGKGIERLADGVIGAARLRRVVADLSPTREQETIDLELPVVEMPVAAAPAPGTARDDRLVLLWSGDGGWRDIDVTIAEGIVAAGVPVVGIDSFSYFWHRRTPVEAARDLEAAIRRYADGWGRKRVVLVGFSFGADILPAAIGGLSPETRARIADVWLLSPGRSADWEISATAYLGGDGPDATPIPPDLERLRGMRLHCVYGEEDADDSLCTEPSVAWMDIAQMPGGHHFDDEYQPIVAAILAGGTANLMGLSN